MVHVQIYAFDRSFEGAIAACGAPLVGILAERLFGFHVSHFLPFHCNEHLSILQSIARTRPKHK